MSEAKRRNQRRAARARTRLAAAGALLRDQRGGITIEKVFYIALFIFIVAIGLQFLANRTVNALKSQAGTIQTYGNQKPVLPN
jgi:cell division protein FtsL